eukprot:422053-Alexandrium_andersonii.AAC.1
MAAQSRPGSRTSDQTPRQPGRALQAPLVPRWSCTSEPCPTHRRAQPRGQMPAQLWQATSTPQ